MGQLPDDVNLARIVEVGLYRGEPAELIEKAPGVQIQHHPYERGVLLSTIAEAPQEHFDKLVRDSEVMAKYGLAPDASDNLFYSKEKGFYWIDPLIYKITDRIDDGLDADRFNYFRQTCPLNNVRNDEEKEKAMKIASKLKEAGAPEPDKTIDESLEDFDEYDPSGADWAEKIRRENME